MRPLNHVLVRLSRRAEAADRAQIVRTFVDNGPLVPVLLSTDHQVLFGRRGAGKTHAMSYLAELKNRGNETSLYVDMRQLGSSAGLYTTGSLPLPERGTRLLVDALATIHEHLRDTAFDPPRWAGASGEALPLLDLLADQITRVRVVGTTELQSSSQIDSDAARDTGFEISLHRGGLRMSDQSHLRRSSGELRRTTGVTEHSVHFGAVGRLLTDVLDALRVERLWLLFDEWSSLPADLQPLLADFIRRCVLPLRKVTLKIAAVEHRSRFAVRTDDGDRIGLELGADISADVDFDDAMVFHSSPERSRAFFAELLTRHVNAHADGPRYTSGEFVTAAFDGPDAFAELVRAAEGIPRDALNILIVAAEHATDRSLRVSDVRAAARLWYARDKAPAALANPEAWALLLFVVDEVIGGRGGLAFVVPTADAGNPLVCALHDARVVHVVRRNVALRARSRTRYHLYTIDYGCYVDVVDSRGRPGADDPAVDVPVDNPRAYRHAILDMREFYASRG